MQKTSYVLVHGAWQGAWSWDRVTPLLRAAGANAMTPVLRGVGERAREREPVPSLRDHVDDVVAAITALPEGRIILVGHSYAGMVVTEAADRVGDRLAHLVYLDAAVPTDGDDFAAQVPGLTPVDLDRRRAAYRALAGDGEWLPAPSPETIGVTRPDDVQWLQQKLTVHPLRTWLEPVSLRHGGLDGLDKTYVMASNPHTTLMGYPSHAERARNMAGWQVFEVASGHNLIVTAPKRVAEILLAVANGENS